MYKVVVGIIVADSWDNSTGSSGADHIVASVGGKSIRFPIVLDEIVRTFKEVVLVQPTIDNLGYAGWQVSGLGEAIVTVAFDAVSDGAGRIPVSIRYNTNQASSDESGGIAYAEVFKVD